MNIGGLFGEVVIAAENNTQDFRDSIPAGHNRRGAAGHHLAIADLQIRGFDAGEIGAIDADIIANVFGLKRSQVKATTNAKHLFGSGGGVAREGRDLLSYKGKIDFFQFVFLPRRAVYYVHIDAVGTPTLPISNWSTQSCDLSFAELVNRLSREVGEAA